MMRKMYFTKLFLMQKTKLKRRKKERIKEFINQQSKTYDLLKYYLTQIIT